MKLQIRDKLIFYVSTASLSAYLIIVGYILLNTQNKAIEDAKTIANQYALRNANDSKALMMHDMGIANAMATEIQQYFSAEDSLRATVVQNLLKGVLEKNKRYYSTWVSLELKEISPNSWNRPYGRQRYTYFNDGSSTIDSLNLQGDDKESLYYRFKLSKKEEITDPYFLNEYSSEGGLQEEILGTSVCVPLLHNGNFAGIVGMDMALNIFDFITKIKPYERASTFLVANNGSIVAHEDQKLIGKNILESLDKTDQNILQKIQSGTFFSFTDELNNEEVYITFAPIKFGSSELPWTMGTIVYMDDMTREIDDIMLYSIILSLLGLIVLVILLAVVLQKIIQPIVQTSGLLKELSKGNMDLDRNQLPVKRADELGDMARSLKSLIESLEQKVSFASKIGENNLDVEIGEIKAEDKLGMALERMRNNLKANNQQALLRNWFTQGVAEFSEVLRYSTGDNQGGKDIYFTIIKKLVDYLKINQGGFYLLVEEEEGGRYIELKGAYAYEKKKHLEQRIELGQGMVGQCVLEAETIYLKEIPQNYIKITSGLGEALPSSLLVVPLKLNDKVLAVVELASFREFQPHEIDFVEKVGESIASFIFSHNITIRTQKLLKDSQLNQEELKAAEEEMRQNIEELEATQEAMKRINSNNRENELMLRALMDGIEDSVLALDPDYRVIAINEPMKESFSNLGYQLKVGDEILNKIGGESKLWADRYQKVFSGEKLEFHMKDGLEEDSSLQCKMNPVFDENGNIEYCLIIFRKRKMKVA